MIGEWVAMRRASSASKRVSFGSTVLIPCFPTDDTSNSDDDGSLDPDDLFGNDDGSEDEGSITLEELVQASEHSFCALSGAGDDDIARRMPVKLSRKLSKSRIGSLSLPLSELHDSTDVTYSESETDVADSSGDHDNNDEVVLLRRLDASLSPRRMKELLGSSLASKFAMSLRTLGRGDEDVDDVSQLTLDVLAGGDRSDNLFVADGEFDPSDPNWLHSSSRSSSIARPSSTITPETIQAAKRKMALRAAQKAARDVGSSSSVLR